ncbi:MAG: hypothetical protein C4524_03315, partial [Candidatus Zixiibacteriota bacterium]
IAIFPNFAVPVALAWEALDRRNSRFLHTDLMPPTVRDAQRTFKVAWHGFAMLGVIFVLMVALAYQGVARWTAIQNLESSLQENQRRVNAMHQELTKLGMVQEQVVNYQANLRFLDSLIVDPGKWSRLLSNLSQDFQIVNRVWVEEIRSTPQGFNLVGKALNRDRIPKLSYLLPQPDLRRVARVVTEEGEITYQFEVNAAVPQPSATEMDSLRRAAPPVFRPETVATAPSPASEAALKTPAPPPGPTAQAGAVSASQD